MILNLLRSETQAQHSAMEARISLMDRAFSLADYQRLLVRFYGYYAPLETRLVAWSLAVNCGFDYAERVKVPELKRDLIALGETAETVARLSRCAVLPALPSEAEGLGCLYVVEGATLGGRVITRQLQKSLGLSPESGVAFFSGYGADTDARWRAFGEFIEEAAARVNQNEAIIAAANDTFRTLGNWLFED